MGITVEKTGITNLGEMKNILENEGYHGIFSWSDSPGSSYDWHTHPEEEVRWVISGSITIGHEGGEVLLQSGDRMNVPAGTRHWAESPGGVTYICGSK